MVGYGNFFCGALEIGAWRGILVEKEGKKRWKKLNFREGEPRFWSAIDGKRFFLFSRKKVADDEESRVVERDCLRKSKPKRRARI